MWHQPYKSLFFRSNRPGSGPQKTPSHSIATINIEGIKSNYAAIMDLLNTCDILVIQEHWLFNFESSYLEDLCKPMGIDYKIRCVDDNDTIQWNNAAVGMVG